MEPFVKLNGVVAPMDRVNIDTDQVIPAIHLKRIERTGYGEFLFESWRYNTDGTPNTDFILNQPGYRGKRFSGREISDVDLPRACPMGVTGIWIPLHYSV
ncbi:MAG: hypothetical protein Ct9H300mP27_02410 [Chloroflexota bacterium]|nr:MAG: hypothetical protein Ct9H300mP27_02410 [Chloroflexota bacterium]